MFQFDAGTYDQTLEREGERILTVAGNVDAAVDFTLSMVVRSRYIDGVDDNAQALEWMNQVRTDNALFHPWIQTVVHYYNGCVPGRCSVYESRYQSYSSKTVALIDELGEDFWYGDVPPCGFIDAEGGEIDEDHPCFFAGGDSRYWRDEEDGFGGSLLWTNATDNDTVANYAVWELFFEEAGLYTVEVYTDASFAQSRQTRYQVVHGGSSQEIVVDQTSVDGFQALGQFEFSADIEQFIRFDDNTGESNESETAIVADAVRLTRVDQAPDMEPEATPEPDPAPDPTDAPEDLQPEVVPEQDSEPEAEDSAQGFPLADVRVNEGCSKSPVHGPHPWPVGIVILGLLALATQRRGP